MMITFGDFIFLSSFLHCNILSQLHVVCIWFISGSTYTVDPSRKGTLFVTILTLSIMGSLLVDMSDWQLSSQGVGRIPYGTKPYDIYIILQDSFLTDRLYACVLTFHLRLEDIFHGTFQFREVCSRSMGRVDIRLGAEGNAWDFCSHVREYYTPLSTQRNDR